MTTVFKGRERRVAWCFILTFPASMDFLRALGGSGRRHDRIRGAFLQRTDGVLPARSVKFTPKSYSQHATNGTLQKRVSFFLSVYLIRSGLRRGF